MKRFGLWSKLSIIISISQLLLAIFKEIQNYNKSKNILRKIREDDALCIGYGF
ncbi:Uncharacterised protein [Pediococcus pentosaceus]|uniref:hypothetical protein n=1 Tax=Pediococcus pentosaceus TaxID=1255 RepID=UPI000DFD7E16|nr:hypothetical protein [Pediococcus pentosaceus]SUB59977.1 Uncharacterised protein [Pediococcus pentosaceus]